MFSELFAWEKQNSCERSWSRVFAQIADELSQLCFCRLSPPNIAFANASEISS